MRVISSSQHVSQYKYPPVRVYILFHTSLVFIQPHGLTRHCRPGEAEAEQELLDRTVRDKRKADDPNAAEGQIVAKVGKL